MIKSILWSRWSDSRINGRSEKQMPRLFSYVVDHDYGNAPCPFGGFCTLAKCKYGTVITRNGSIRRNIVELAEEGDWIAGTGGVDLSKSAGNGKLIYAMRVEEIISLAEYCRGNIGNLIDADFLIRSSALDPRLLQWGARFVF